MGPLRRAAAAAMGLAVASARSMADFPLEVRRENVVRITTKECDECVTLEAFYEANPLGFVLFFERALVGSHKYKEAIVRGFHETCADLRFSRIACGVVDMLDDKEYAERYIDPKTAPAHIAVRNGEPVPTPKAHIQQLMKKPGEKSTVLWHIHELLSPDDVPVIAPGALRQSVEATESEVLDGILENHELVVVGCVGDSKMARDTVRSAFQSLLHRGEVPGEVGVPPLSGDDAKKKKKRRAERVRRQRGRVVFAAVHGEKAMRRLKSLSLAEGSVAAFVRGQLQPVVASLDRKADELKAAEALRSVALAAAEVQKGLMAEEAAAAAAAAPPAAAPPADGPRQGKGAQRGGKGAAPRTDL